MIYSTFVNLMYIMVISQMYMYGYSVYVYMNVCTQTYIVDVCTSYSDRVTYNIAYNYTTYSDLYNV